MRAVGTLDGVSLNHTFRWNVRICKLLFVTDEVFRWKTIKCLNLMILGYSLRLINLLLPDCIVHRSLPLQLPKPFLHLTPFPPMISQAMIHRRSHTCKLKIDLWLVK